MFKKRNRSHILRTTKTSKFSIHWIPNKGCSRDETLSKLIHFATLMPDEDRNFGVSMKTIYKKGKVIFNLIIYPLGTIKTRKSIKYFLFSDYERTNTDCKTVFTFTYFPRTSMRFQLVFPFKHPLKIYIHSLALQILKKEEKKNKHSKTRTCCCLNNTPCCLKACFHLNHADIFTYAYYNP